ncbi:macro domain-containing protein [Thiomicrospira microaerophila]|uniref:macro domain-containing protein n=1 Tax=Thiomicrospira microaerophila TaxID=406020 RepID=UPI000A9DDE06|nr:macro domain-containing protein [Thiomicrospira microaerophila]
MKVKITDRSVWQEFLKMMSMISAILSIAFIFIDVSDEYKNCAGLSVVLFFVGLYLYLWWRYNNLRHLNLSIDGSKVSVLTGDLFSQPGIKAIAFNEYFDTQVDDKIISKNSLNGIYINEHSNLSVAELNQIIEDYPFEDGELIDGDVKRTGKSKKYKLGTVCLIEDYLLAAFSKFDSQNKAVLSMPEYLEFLINFWDSVNRVYSQKSVSVPIFGSGITRIKEHKNISDEELLKIMLWTFRVSEMKFKYPAKLNIVIHKDKIDSINLLDIKAIENGI